VNFAIFRKDRGKGELFRSNYLEDSIASLCQRSCSILALSPMSSQITRKLFTIDGCYKMVEVGLSADDRTELINGEILVVPPPGPRLIRAALTKASGVVPLPQ
jgi:hypothetical protein